MTTVGYGDLALCDKEQDQLFVTVFAIFSVVLVAGAIGTLGNLYAENDRQNREAKMLASFDMDMIKALDQDGDGVDKNEYVLGMLSALGHLGRGDRGALREAVQLVRCRWEWSPDGGRPRRDQRSHQAEARGPQFAVKKAVVVGGLADDGRGEDRGADDAAAAGAARELWGSGRERAVAAVRGVLILFYRLRTRGA